MMRIVVSFELGQKISSTLSILLVLFLSMLVAILTLKAARDIIDTTERSPIYHVEKRVGGGKALNDAGVSR